jgi:ketosteroid isomerase-like protein
MKTKPLSLSGCVVLFSFTFVCLAPAADTKSAIEKALRDLDAQWSAAAGVKDIDKTVSYYSDDAAVMPPNALECEDKGNDSERLEGNADDSRRCHQLESDQG